MGHREYIDKLIQVIYLYNIHVQKIVQTVLATSHKT